MDELAAYHEGTLSSGARERLQEHLVSCRECRSELLGFARFSASGPPRGEADLSDRDVEGLWQRMQPHLEGDGYEDPFRGRADETPVLQHAVPRNPAPIVHPIPQRTSAQGRRTSYALAATLVVGLVGFGLWNASLQRQVRAARQIQVNPTQIAQATIFLEEPPPGDQRSTDSVPEEKLSRASINDLRLRLPEESAGRGSYSIRIVEVGRSDEPLVDLPVERLKDNSFGLRIPANLLAAGSYKIQLLAREDGISEAVVASCRIRMID